MRCFAVCLLLLLNSSIIKSAHSEEPIAAFNYAEALQKSLYFYEAQQSGNLSPNNRVAWRGDCCLDDGQDIRHDLAGGWFDAGDHWSANLTMSFAAMTLAWSAIEQPQGYLQSGQMEELLESLIHVNRYFLKCVLNPECVDPATQLEIAIGCGGREGVTSPRVHDMWAAAEVAHLMTNRPTFRLTRNVPGGDIPGAMAAAMAASSMVIRQHASVLNGLKGYENFDADQFADQLLNYSEMLVLFAHANSGEVITDDATEDQKAAIQQKRRLALRGDGEVVEIGYRADPFDKVFTAASFLQRAHIARDPNYGSRWADFADEIYEGAYKQEHNDGFYRDFGHASFGKLGVYNMMRLKPDAEKFHFELQDYCINFYNYKQTPGGLRLREWWAHEYGSLRHANNASAIALYYSDHIEQSPTLSGNTWWRDGKSNTEWKQRFQEAARSQVDYALGDNPYHRSYLAGFGNNPFNDVHHRGAYGAWAGFHHFIEGKSELRPNCRHVLYGALVAGPDNNDVFFCGDQRRPWMEIPNAEGHDFFYRFANRDEPVRKTGYVFNNEDQPLQDVMDSKFNEVALDYNAGITASFAWLIANGLSNGNALPDEQFPPKEKLDESNNLMTTDREFFVAAKELKSNETGIEIEAIVYNRSRWPTRVADELAVRYYFTLDDATKLDQVRATAECSDGKAECELKQDNNGGTFVEVTLTEKKLYPGDRDKQTDFQRFNLRVEAPSWDNENDWSHHKMNTDVQLLPRFVVTVHGEPHGQIPSAGIRD